METPRPGMPSASPVQGPANGSTPGSDSIPVAPATGRPSLIPLPTQPVQKPGFNPAPSQPSPPNPGMPGMAGNPQPGSTQPVPSLRAGPPRPAASRGFSVPEPDPVRAPPPPPTMANDPNRPLPVVDSLATSGLGGKITAFGGQTRRHEDSWARTPNTTGSGAIHVKTFHCKLTDDALAYLDQSINEWLDAHPQYEVKFVSSSIGILTGKLKEPALICQVWV